MAVGQQTRSRPTGASLHGDGAHSGGAGVLAPRRSGVSARVGTRAAGHPIVAWLTVAVIGFVLLATATVIVGWLLKTYVLPEHGIGHADEHVNVWLAHHRTGMRNDVSFWLSGIGDVYAIPALVALTAVGAMVLRRWRIAAFIVTAILIEAATYRAATLLIHRQRPHVPRLDDLPANASYYSGHTAASVAVYCGLALLITSHVRSTGLRVACWAVAIAIPLLVASSRMYRGMHHPTDVAAGLLVGTATLIIAICAARAAKSAELAGEAAR